MLFHANISAMDATEYGTGTTDGIDMTVSPEYPGMTPEDVIKKCYSVYGGCDNLIASSFRKEITTTTVSGELVKAREATSVNRGDNPPGNGFELILNDSDLYILIY